MLKRLAEFLRSVIPADPTQLRVAVRANSAVPWLSLCTTYHLRGRGWLFRLFLAGQPSHPSNPGADMLSCDSRNVPHVWSDCVSHRAFLFNPTRHKEPGSQQDQLGVLVAM